MVFNYKFFMSITNIINHLESQHQAKLLELSKDKNARMSALKKQWEDKMKIEKQKILNEYQRKVNQNLAQINFLQKELYKKEVLRKKQELIDQLFSDLYRELLALPEKDYLVLIDGALKKLPNVDGTIQVSEVDASLFDDALQKVGRKDQILVNKKIKDRGFIYSNDKVVIDYTFLFVLRNLKGDSLIDLNNFLFS